MRTSLSRTGIGAGGWVALPRAVFDDPLFKFEPMSEREAWIWLLASAAWKTTRHRVGAEMHDVPRGSLFTTLRELQATWGWRSDKRVRTFLKRLQAECKIELRLDAGKTRVSICDFDVFQGSGHSGHAAGTQANARNGRAKEEETRKQTLAKARDGDAVSRSNGAHNLKFDVERLEGEA